LYHNDLGWRAFAHGDLAAANGSNDDNLVFRVATCVDKPVPTLAFVVQNAGRRQIETTPICTNYNRLIVRYPSGEVQEEFAWKKGIAPVVIAPGQSMTWYVTLAEQIKMTEPGFYGIRWRIGEATSEEHLLLRGEAVDSGKTVP